MSRGDDDLNNARSQTDIDLRSSDAPECLPAKDPGTRRFFEVLQTIATIIFLVVTAFWLTPDKAPSAVLKQVIVNPIKTFWLFWGLEQNWALFSPIIKDINYHTVGIITRQDGSNEIWEAPRMDKLDLLERFRQEKYRKWSIDSLPWPDHKEFWPYIARYVGRQKYRADNPPAKFTLLLFWTKIPPPLTSFTSRGKLPPHTSCNNVFTYEYSAEDFR
ncbi:hypothetical protein KF707_03745 [Candidatus Obscuribacterales bacterium]|nr:hypothetical protein [Candidatus Obscuribacterales bacterium]MBX3153393.1 hypothetical protein [Candidatus Obscuribacterales bacterium]